MKKKYLIGLSTGVFMLWMVGIASATIIDFEGFPTYTVITDQYQGLGVNFTNNGLASIWGGISNSDPGHWGLEGTNGASFYGIQADSVITISFDNIISDFALDTSRSNGSQDTNTFTLTAFLSGSKVDSQTITQRAINNWTTVTFSGFFFDQVQLTSGNGRRPVYGIDNLRFTEQQPVPEPSTILLMGIGLLGLIGIKTRKKKS